MHNEHTVDILAFSPHPDDAELYCGGTLLMLKQRGFSIGVVDLTHGELSTRGTTEKRSAESAEASRILDLDYRGNLTLPDGDINTSPTHKMAVVREVRKLRPRTVLLPYERDRHPDHEHASTLVREALFASGLQKILTHDHDGSPQKAYRPSQAYYYMLTHDFDPYFIVDISSVFDTKMKAIEAYASQFGLDASSEAETYISRPEFLQSLVGRSQRLGFHVGGKYGEGFIPLQPQRFDAEWMLS